MMILTANHRQWLGDLKTPFRIQKAASKRNLKLIRQWHPFGLDSPIGQQPVAQLAKQPASQVLSIPRGHTLPEALRDKLPSIEAIERELGLDVGDKA